MRRIIKHFIKQQHIENTWEFSVRLVNGEESGPYTFKGLADLIIEGTLSGDEEVAWYPHGRWVALGEWDLFQELLMEFVENNKGTPEQMQQWKNVLHRFPTARHMPEPPGESEKTKLIEPSEQEWHPQRVEKRFVQPKIEEEVVPNLLKIWIPRALLILLVVGVAYLLIVEPKLGKKTDQSFVEVVLPSMETTPFKPEEAKNYIKTAKNLMAEDTPIAFQQGITELRQALLHDPKNLEARLMLAELYALLWRMTDKNSKSNSVIKTLIDQSGGVPGTSRVSARLAFEQGKISEAKGILKLVSIGDWESDILRAELAIGEHEYQKAIKVLQEIIELNPESIRAHYNLGRAFEESGKLQEAIDEFSRTVSIGKQHGQAKLHLALLQLQLLSDIGKAEELLKNVTQFPSFLFPEQLAQAHFYLGKIYENRTQIDFAIREYSQAVRRDPTQELYKQALVKLGGESALEKIAFKGSKEDGADYYVSLGTQYFNEGHIADSIAQYKLALQIDPKSAVAYYNLGKAYSRNKEYQPAIEALQQAITNNPTDVNPYLELAAVFTDSYQYKSAQEVLQKARDLEPANPNVFLASGKFFEHKNELNRAKYEYSRAVELAPALPEARVLLGQVLVEFEEYDAAIKEADKALALNPNFEKGYVLLAEATFRKGFQTKAVGFLKQRIAHEPLNPLYYRSLGKVYSLSGNTDLAIDNYREAIKLEPSSGENYRSLASIYEKEEKWDEALLYYNMMVKVDPKNSEGLFNQAHIYYQTGDYVSAIKTLNRVVELNKSYPKVHFNLGRIYALLNHKRQAIDEFKKEIHYNPDLSDIYESHLALGDIYYGLQDFEKAKNEYEAALKENPSIFRAYLNLGRSYRSLGQLDSAEEVFNTLLKQDPSNAQAWKDLGELAEGRENNEVAIHAFEQYLLHNPAALDADEIRSKVRRLTNIYQPTPSPEEAQEYR